MVTDYFAGMQIVSVGFLLYILFISKASTYYSVTWPHLFRAMKRVWESWPPLMMVSLA
ncbi:MAG: hypothetical protein GPOALKHO_000244 [Sodalis sp.]|nr:MAG: hypothetical protein GPOALKHO_000244 [Sodalis sp.]